MKRSKFNLSYTKLYSCDMGELIPAGLMEVLPGDSIQMQTRLLVRCAPMLTPPMHPVRVRIHHWFVPHRLVWSNWENFITGGPDGNNASVFPTITAAISLGTSPLDYMGVPPGITSTFSAIPLRGYQLIWNEWYRDQDLQTAATIVRTDGNDASTSGTLQTCAWEKDYFTSARPWEQKGPAVSIPLVGQAPVVGIGVDPADASVAVNRTIGQTVGTSASVPTLLNSESEIRIQLQNAGAAYNTTTNRAQIFADLSGVSGVTVNQLRQSLAIQRFEEARAMYGSRYPEYLRAIGVRSSDARLQRPEYLGGGVQTIQFSEVIQTAADGANPVSTLRGHGIAALRSNRFRRFFEEHGYVFTMVSVLPKTNYANGLFRHWNRRTKYDFWQKELENIGQQTVLNKEVYAGHSSPDGVFGYQDRYDEYRRSESNVGGEFRTTLNTWHFARIFASDPTLNATFVAAVPPERPFAAPSADVLYCHAHHSIQARRLLSFKASPKTF